MHEVALPDSSLMVRLHNGDDNSKLVPFEVQKKNSTFKKGPSLERFTP
jgi:hypothetical protein